jgi:hypothetical protein
MIITLFATLALVVFIVVATAVTFIAGMLGARRLAKLMPVTRCVLFNNIVAFLTQDLGSDIESFCHKAELPSYVAFCLLGGLCSWLAVFGFASTFLLTWLYAAVEETCEMYCPHLSQECRLAIFRLLGQITVVLTEVATDVTLGGRPRSLRPSRRDRNRGYLLGM